MKTYNKYRESVDIDTDLIAALALKKYPNKFPSDNEIEEIICDKYKAILPSNRYRPKRDEVRRQIADIMEASGMKELNASDHVTRFFKVENLDNLQYIINGLEGIIENYDKYDNMELTRKCQDSLVCQYGQLF